MNQKGQAFSVFELMIAAIVAVAILFVLLPIISGGFSFNTTPKDAISNSLSAVKDGGQTTSQDFDLQPNQTLKSSQFTDNGFDAHSIVFAVSEQLEAGGKIEVAIENDEFSYLTYTGSTPQPAKAVVICEQTGESLDETIGISSEKIQDAMSASSVNVTDLCDVDEYQPCCVVIIERR